MFKPNFMNILTFLHQKTKSLLNNPTIRRRKKHLRFFSSSNSKLSVSPFIDTEVSNQFKQVFKIIDTNGDGKISTSELSEVLSCLGYKKRKAAKEAEGMVREMDFNGDGFIDLDEFMVVMNGFEGENGGGKEGNDDYLMDAFLVFDADKNGLISAKELQRVLMNLGSDKCSLKECKRMIKGFDKNGDGFVDFEEFRSMMKFGVAN